MQSDNARAAAGATVRTAVDILQTPEWRRLRLDCYERDKAAHARCALCGGEIDYDAKPSSHDYAYEPDHKLPREKHPELALVPENIQAAHRTCNRSKGSKASIKNLGVPSREW